MIVESPLVETTEDNSSLKSSTLTAIRGKANTALEGVSAIKRADEEDAEEISSNV